ncbi:hypothetical protein F5Y00DRAFT_259885 [Daldinia vernicosa]|uniref:uncharacterized protein n=1 Tax=Daldinia vernicosa TaxID=114800 RepID=UPI0020089AC2|nr:uncharacterized protein F5Y00DRAFT_259885 [Daldinia vernicosa]KAI0851348.1 hypothetical protein F5Y00DRAFT_259885 [Daldinia vernicosa]
MGWIHNTPDNTATNGPTTAAVASVLSGVSFCFICLRGYVRSRLIHALGIDDWIIFITWILTCGFTVVTAIQTTWGLGMKHVDDMPPQNIYPFGQLELAGFSLYILSILGFKLSLLVSYFRFVPQGMCKYGVTCVLVSCTLFHLSCLIVQLNQCHPIAKKWDPTVPGRCINQIPYYMASSALAVVFDFAVMFLPLPVILKTKIQLRKKVMLLGLFALGFFITGIQIIRIQFLKDLSNPLNSGPVVLWSTVEANLGVIVACIPVLSPLFKQNRDNYNKGTPESTWGNTITPSITSHSCMVARNHMSEDDLLDREKDNNNRLTSTNSREPINIGNGHILRETDVVIVNQLAPAHLTPPHDTELGGRMKGNYECWARSTNMTIHDGFSSHSLDRI